MDAHQRILTAPTAPSESIPPAPSLTGPAYEHLQRIITMTQHTEDFLRECITVTDDGSLATVDEVEGLYLYWCSLRTGAGTDTGSLLETLVAHGVEPVQQDGVDYLEGVILAGPVVADFISSCDFAGAWGHPDPRISELLRDVATAS